MSKQKADQNAKQTANQTALKGFPKAKLKQAFKVMAEGKAGEEAQSEQRVNAAHDVTMLAHKFAAKHVSDGIDVDTIVTGWRDNMKLIATELAAAGNRFAEQPEPDKNGKAKPAKFTGYGNNVVSIAKGTIEYEIDPTELSFRDVRKRVEAARLEARRIEKPDEAALTDAKNACDEAWSNLRKRVFELNELKSVNSLTGELEAMLTDVNQQIEERINAEAKADADEAEAEVTEENTTPDTEGDDDEVAEAA